MFRGEAGVLPPCRLAACGALPPASLTPEPHFLASSDERASHSAPKSRFFDELEDYMTEELAEQTMRTVISWGRYAEVFAYDDHRQVFSLENPA